MPRIPNIVAGQLYHGTKFQNLKSILKLGLKKADAPKKGATQQFKKYHFDAVNVICLTNHRGNACFYATASYPIDEVMTKVFIPVVIVIDRTKLLEEYLLQRKSSGIPMYRGSKEFDYIMNIPPEAIIGFWKFDKEKRKYNYFKNNGEVIE